MKNKLSPHFNINSVAPIRIVTNAENYGERYVVDPELHASLHKWNRHPLREPPRELRRQ
jgi:hypothetical protein